MTSAEANVGSNRFVAVPKEHAEEVIRRLQANDLVDRTQKISKRDGFVLVPVRVEPRFDLTDLRARVEKGPRLPDRSASRDPCERIRERLDSAGIPREHAPRRWERVGDVLVIRIPSPGRPRAKEIAEVFGTVLGAQAVVEDLSGIHGPLRIPDARVLWGGGTETVHTEGGVHYCLDVARVMLSSGNVSERMGIAARVRPGAVVVDLFAGIGYFTLPIAVHSRAQHVYACELNPTSFEYLLKNIRLNRTTNVIPLRGDCREVAPPGIADWVIMGHFDARDYLDVAFRTLRGRGWIVYHEICPKEQFPDAMTQRLAEAARARWMAVLSMQTRIVKSYAPGIVHVAAEVEVAPQSRG